MLRVVVSGGREVGAGVSEFQLVTHHPPSYHTGLAGTHILEKSAFPVANLSDFIRKSIQASKLQW